MSPIYFSSAPTRTAITLIETYSFSTPCGFLFRIRMLNKMLARSSIPVRTSPRCASGHILAMLVCAPTRNRTQNSTSEASRDIRFTIGACLS